MPRLYYALRDILPADIFPADLLALETEDFSLLDDVYVADVRFRDGHIYVYLSFDMVLEEKLEIPFPALQEMYLVLGGGEDGELISVEAEWGDLDAANPARSPLGEEEDDDEHELPEDDQAAYRPERFNMRCRLEIQVMNIGIRRSLLQPVQINPGTAEITPVPDEDLLIRFSPLRLSFDLRSGITLGGIGEGILEINASAPFTIGETRVVLDVQGLFFKFASQGPVPSWATDHGPGLYVEQLNVYLPPEFTVLVAGIAAEHLIIAERGVSGTIRGIWVAPTLTEEGRFLTENADGTPVRATIGEFSGMQIAMRELAFRLRQNQFEECRIALDMVIPFFNSPLSLSVAIDSKGGFTAMLSASQLSARSAEGLITIEKEGLLAASIESVMLESREGITLIAFKGKIRPLLGGMDWPAFEINRLGIDSNGQILFDGGWVDLPSNFTLDLHGFKITLSQFGLGSETVNELERQWLGFSGEVQLVEGLPIKGSVDGLKISWLKDTGGDMRVSLRGIGVELTIPGTLSFSGAVSYDENTNLFKGNIRLNLIALRTEIEGQLMVGKYRDAEGREFGVFYITLSAQLPTAIPLAATGTGLYGIRGLAGINVAPDKAEESWYEWYKSGNNEDERYSVSHVNKWMPMFDNYAFGAGITLGTVYDDGTTINMNAMLVVLIPGPVIMLEGKANLLKQRSDNKSEEGAFYLLAVLDGRAGTFQLNIDVRYSLEDIVSVGGGMEAFFDFNDGDNWHIWIGQKDPEAKRIRAEILSLFSVTVYFMIDPKALMFGASAGLNINENYGPVSLRIIVRLSLDAAIFFKPFQLEGSLQFLMDLGVTVFGIGLRLYLEALLSGKTPQPFEVYGKAKLLIGLFWPLPDIECEVEFRWEKPAETLPVWPLLKALAPGDVPAEIAVPARQAVMQHHKSSALRVALLELAPETLPSAEEISRIPVSPVDARPALTFSKKLHFLGSQQVAEEPDRPGNGEFWYHLEDLRLEKSPDGRTWETVRHGINEEGTEGLPFFKINITEDPDNGDGFFQNGNDAGEPVIELWKYHVWDRLNLYQRQTQHHDTPACGRQPQKGYPGIAEWLDEVPRNLAPEFEHQGLTFITVPGPANPQGADAPREPYIGFIPGGNQKIVLQKNMLRTRSTTVFFPERCVQAQVFIFFEKSEYEQGDGINDDLRALKIQAFDRGVAAGRVTHSSQSGFLVVQASAATGFDSLGIHEEGSADNAFWLYCILYQVAGEFEPANVQTSQEDDPTRRNSYTRQTPVLMPDTFYRLSVRTRVSGSKTNEETTCLYFRTDAGPGIPHDPRQPASLLPYSARLHTDGSVESEGNPAAQFESYVAATFPQHGALAHYFEEPLVIGFNERYLLKIFEGRPFRLRIRDRNGNYLPLPDENGRAALLKIPLRPAGLMSWLNSLQSGQCRPASDAPAQMMPGLSFLTPALQPGQLYFAELSVSQHGSTVKLFDFQFTTSRYAHFGAHIGKLGTDVQPFMVAQITLDAALLRQPGLCADRMRYLHELEQYDRLIERMETGSSSGAPSHQAVVSAFETVQQLKARWEEQSATLFDQLDLLTVPAFVTEGINPDGTRYETDMRQRGLPPHPEIIAIPIRDSTHALLLLESPEPVDWAGIAGTTAVPASGPQISHFIANRDGTRAFLLIGDQLGAPSATPLHFVLSWRPFNRFETSTGSGSGVSGRQNTEFTVTIRP